jgi:hypothetical protein
MTHPVCCTYLLHRPVSAWSARLLIGSAQRVRLVEAAISPRGCQIYCYYSISYLLVRQCLESNPDSVTRRTSPRTLPAEFGEFSSCRKRTRSRGRLGGHERSWQPRFAGRRLTPKGGKIGAARGTVKEGPLPASRMSGPDQHRSTDLRTHTGASACASAETQPTAEVPISCTPGVIIARRCCSS